MPRKYVKKTQKRKTVKKVQRAPRKYTRKTAIIRNPLSQNSLMVPLQYPFSYTLSTSNSAPVQFLYNGSGYPNDMGTLLPDPLTGKFNYEMPVGLAQYGAMYHKFRVHGSALDVTMTNLSDSKFRAGLITLPYDASVRNGDGISEGPGIAGWSAVPAGNSPGNIIAGGAINDYLTAGYVDLLNDPFMKWRTIHESTNPRCQTRFKASRKTKNVIGVKDLKDVDQCVSDIISTDYDSNPDPVANSGIPTARRGFCWYIKTDAPAEVDIFVQGKITYWIEVFERVIVKNPDYNEDGPIVV